MTRLNNATLVAAASCLFIAGSAIVAIRLEPAPAEATLAGCALAAWIALTSRGDDADGFLDRPIDVAMLSGCFAAALALCVVSGEGHFFYANTDWLIRDAVLADLVNNGVPAAYRYEGVDYLLRAPLGMYMIPALVGREFGLYSAHLAQLAQNACLLTATLYTLGSFAPGRRAPYLALFLLFSGLNIVPTTYLAYERSLAGGPLLIPTYTEGWFHLFAFSSHITQIFFVPNHTLPGWWLAALAMLRARRNIDLGALIAMVGPLMFWSPLAILVAPLILMFFAARAPLRETFSGRNWIAGVSAIGFLPLAVFITCAADAVPGEWLIARPEFAMTYAIFMAIEIPHAAVALAYWRLIPRSDRGLLGLALLVILIIPIYSFGPFNDLAMRGSIPSLAILALAFAGVAMGLDAAKYPLGRLAAIAIVAIGGFTPGFEIMRGFTRAPYKISDCDLLAAWYDTDHSKWAGNYFAPAARVPGWLVRVGDARPRVELHARSCWPDYPEPQFIHNN